MNLHDLLKEHLYAGEERIVISTDHTEFLLIFSCFHNYEVSMHIAVMGLCMCMSVL